MKPITTIISPFRRDDRDTLKISIITYGVVSLLVWGDPATRSSYEAVS